MTEPAKADAVLVPAEEGDAVPLAAVAAEAAEVGAAGADELELELAPELQAAAPATRQAPTTAIRHLEPPGIQRDIPVKRTIALPPLCGEQSRFRPSAALLRLHRRRTKLIDQ